MKILSLIRKQLIFIVILVVVIFFTYKDLPLSFFQQDEWLGFGNYIYSQSKGLSTVMGTFLPGDPIQHFNPLANAYGWITFFLFYTNFTPYAWTSIILHIINAILLFYFLLIWTKNKEIAFMAALFFGVNSIPSQAVTWVAAANSYEVPTALAIISLIFFHKFLTDEKKQKLHIFISLAMIFISLFFHENAIFLFFLYPLILFQQAKSRWKKLLPILCIAVVIFVGAFILVRLPFFFGNVNTTYNTTDISHPPFTVFPYRVISLAIKSYAASFIPDTIIIKISESVIKVAYPQFILIDNSANPFIAQSIVFDLVSYVLSTLVVCLIILCIKFFTDKNLKKILIWSLIYIPLSVIPYAFVLGKAGYASIFEPKFLYIPSIGASVIISAVAYGFLTLFKKSRIKKAAVLLFLGSYLLFHIFQTWGKIIELQKMGNDVRRIISTIYSSYPHLPTETIFFTQSDTAYFGMPEEEKSLPTQIGFGRMLMIWYQSGEKFPACLYESNFLINLLDQGYKTCGGRSFGYYRDYDTLKKSVEKNNVPLDNIFSFSWSENAGTIKNISKEIKLKLQKNEK